MANIPDPPGIEVDDPSDPHTQGSRQYADHNDLGNFDPDNPVNTERLDRQYDQNQDDLLLPGSEPGGMEIHGGIPLDEDDGGLEGIHPNDDDEIDNSGNTK